MKDYTGHEAEMNYREWEEKQPVSKEQIEKIEKELEEARKCHPQESEFWELFSEEAQKEMIEKWESENKTQN